MATITPRKNKNGIITSYTIRVLKYVDDNGKKHYENTSFKVDPSWKESSAKKKAEAYAHDFENGIKNGMLSNEKRSFDEYAEYVIQLKETTKTCNKFCITKTVNKTI